MPVRQRRAAAPIKPTPKRTMLPGSGTGEAAAVNVDVPGLDVHAKVPEVVLTVVRSANAVPEIGPIELLKL